jgi:CheY-like chemotaxis protein
MPKRILLVEDDLDSALVLKKILSQAGYSVDTLADGQFIVERKFAMPDLFILDNCMPAIDGLALCKYLKVKSDTRAIPIFVISGNLHLKTKAQKAGAVGFYGKPINAGRLLKAIDSLFKNRKENVHQTIH